MVRVAAAIAAIPNRKIIDPITFYLHPEEIAKANAPATPTDDGKKKKKK